MGIAMRKVISFVHVSLDGFVAGPKGEMNWITISEEIFDYVAKLLEPIDTALYGRVTFEMMENYWPTAGDAPDASKHDREHSRWYEKAKKIVLSDSLRGKSFANTTIISGGVADEIKKAKQADGSDIVIFGSPRATHSLMKEDLVDGYWMFVNPVILGSGIPLFAEIEGRTQLTLVESKKLSSGVAALQFVRK
jgi:dihydrofolate reductase